MKYQLTLLAFALVLTAFGPVGCDKSDSTGASSAASSAPSLDLSKFDGAFSSATGAIKTEWDKVSSSIKAGDYSGALTSLQTLASNAGLSADQKSALSDLVAQVKAKAGDLAKGAGDAAAKMATQAKDAANKAGAEATDAAKKALPK